MLHRYVTSICLEGNAGSGKTTCCMAMTRAINGVFLREYTETLGDQHRDFLMRSFERESNEDESGIWSHAEALRASAMPRACGRPAVLDTSLLSVVAFGCARLAFGRGGDLAATVCTYRALLAEGQLVLPGKVVHLSASEEVRQSRLAKRGNCHPFLTRTDVSQYIEDIRMEFFERHLPRESWVSIDTSSLSPDEVTKRVIVESEQLQARQTVGAFDAWLSNLKH